MTESNARKLIQYYINGWKNNDREEIIATLTNDCEIIESHGPVYQGIQEVENWISWWLENTWQVDAWEITSFYFTEQTAMFEWHFVYSSKTEAPKIIDGMSIAKFSAEKICYLREYRTTQKLSI